MSAVRTALPDFLVIGGMKCATTTLYEDFRLNPEIFLPGKELNALLNPDCVTESGVKAYSDLFRSAGQSQLRGDVSTEYSMLPRHTNVAERAFEILGESAKIIYLVRNPVERALSHHMHSFNTHGPEVIGDDINREIHSHPNLVDFGKYAMQLRPWIDKFGISSIKVVRFEDYTADRVTVLSEICEFLGVAAVNDSLNKDGANRGDSRPVAKGLWTRVLSSGWYRQGVRKLMPSMIRNRIRDAVLAKPELRKVPPSQETIEFLIKELEKDANQLAEMLNWPTPIWDFDETRLRYSDSAVDNSGQ